ncbi:MAG: hypothetical protein LBD47_05215, partial [Treponema sp.]|nr:hypothetical protein [Treponema sp.]
MSMTAGISKMPTAAVPYRRIIRTLPSGFLITSDGLLGLDFYGDTRLLLGWIFDDSTRLPPKCLISKCYRKSWMPHLENVTENYSCSCVLMRFTWASRW